MKALLGLTLLTLVISNSAMAAPQPWKAMVGNYTLSEECSMGYKDGFNKAKIVLSNDGKKLNLTAYKGAYTELIEVPVAKYQRPSHGSDGDVYFDVQRVSENSFVSTEHFVRKGSGTWPDLEMLEVYTLSLQNGTLTYEFQHRDTFKNSKNPRISTCELKAVPKDLNQLTTFEITRFSDLDLENLSRTFANVQSASMDFDQAGFQFAAVKMNKVTLSYDEVVEILVQYAQIEDADVEVKSVTVSDPAKMAAESLGTVLGIAEEKLNTPEYKPIVNFRDTVANVLAKRKANLKMIKISWEGSDADGEGLLLIDTNTGEALYFGSGYFS